MSKFNPYAKAIVAAVMAGLAAYQAALITPGVSAGEWAGIAVAVVGAFAVVWGVPNVTEPPARNPVEAVAPYADVATTRTWGTPVA